MRFRARSAGSACAVADASGTWALLASHCCNSARVSWLGWATLEISAGAADRPRLGGRAASASRAAHPGWRRSTPASSHHARALRASAIADCVQVPTHYAILHPALTVRSRNWQGRGGRTAFAARREDRMTERESMQYDVVIVGAGPAGLTAAIRLKQLAAKSGARNQRLHPRKRQRGRRAHPVRRGDRSQGAERADPRLEGSRRAADRAGHRKPPLDPDREGQVARCPNG